MTIVVMSPHYWGSGETLAEAKKNLRRHGGSTKGEHVILTFGEDSEFLGVDDFGRYHWNGEAPVVEGEGLVDLVTLMAICQEYRNMGDAVIDQLKAVVQDDSEESLSQQNSNALRICAGWLRDVENTLVYGPAAEQAHDLRERINAWVNDLPEPPRREV